jgi:hypothetical protein
LDAAPEYTFSSSLVAFEVLNGEASSLGSASNVSVAEAAPWRGGRLVEMDSGSCFGVEGESFSGSEGKMGEKSLTLDSDAM